MWSPMVFSAHPWYSLLIAINIQSLFESTDSNWGRNPLYWSMHWVTQKKIASIVICGSKIENVFPSLEDWEKENERVSKDQDASIHRIDCKCFPQKQRRKSVMKWKYIGMNTDGSTGMRAEPWKADDNALQILPSDVSLLGRDEPMIPSWWYRHQHFLELKSVCFYSVSLDLKSNWKTSSVHHRLRKMVMLIASDDQIFICLWWQTKDCLIVEHKIRHSLLLFFKHRYIEMFSFWNCIMVIH
jgi:hypothetical protein